MRSLVFLTSSWPRRGRDLELQEDLLSVMLKTQQMWYASYLEHAWGTYHREQIPFAELVDVKGTPKGEDNLIFSFPVISSFRKSCCFEPLNS